MMKIKIKRQNGMDWETFVIDADVPKGDTVTNLGWVVKWEVE